MDRQMEEHRMQLAMEAYYQEQAEAEYYEEMARQDEMDREYREYQSEFLSSEAERDGFDMRQSDAARFDRKHREEVSFDFSREPEDAGRDMGSARRYLEEKPAWLRRAEKEYNSPQEQARQASSFGMTARMMAELGMHPDGTPFDSGPAVSDPEGTGEENKNNRRWGE